MATLVELAAEIVSSHASTSAMTTDQLLLEIQKVYASLQALETGKVADVSVEEAKPAMTIKQAFKKDEVICLVCGKGGMKTLSRHLMKEHGLKPGQYRKQFGIKSSQSLTAKNFSESRRQMAMDRGLADNLAKAREVRAAKIKASKAQTVKPAALTKAVKAAVPAKPTTPAKAKTTKTSKPKATPKANK